MTTPKVSALTSALQSSEKKKSVSSFDEKELVPFLMFFSLTGRRSSKAH
jgi:hypothetical protein